MWWFIAYASTRLMFSYVPVRPCAIGPCVIIFKTLRKLAFQKTFSNQISKRHNFWKKSIMKESFFCNFDKFKKSNKWKLPMNSWISSRNFLSFNSSALFKCHLVRRMFVLLHNCKYDFSWIQYPFPKVLLHTLCYNWFPTHCLRFLKA